MSFRGQTMRRAACRSIGIKGKWPAAAALLALAALVGCDNRNTYVPPPPPKVTVAKPVQRNVTLYLEATGNARRSIAPTWSRACPASSKPSTTMTAMR